MNNLATINVLDDLTRIKKMTESEKRVDIRFVMERMSSYSRSDLYLFRDCIDLVLICKDNQ
jgi:hypothetical protein